VSDSAERVGFRVPSFCVKSYSAATGR